MTGVEGKNIVKEGEVGSVGITLPMHTQAGLQRDH